MKILGEIYKIYTLLHLLEPIRKTMKNASGKRPPDETHGTGKETIRPQQCSEAWGGREKKVHRARCSNSESRDCADSKDKNL